MRAKGTALALVSAGAAQLTWISQAQQLPTPTPLWQPLPAAHAPSSPGVRWEVLPSDPKAKQQMKAEVIFLTHSSDLHDINMQWNPKGEEYLWTPDIQQTKANKSDVICYKYGFKGENVKAFCSGIKKFIPWCEVRYAF